MSEHVPSDSRYKMGCRCDECRVAHADYTRRRRQLALIDNTLTHGRRATYDAGCRCDPLQRGSRHRLLHRPQRVPGHETAASMIRPRTPTEHIAELE